MPGDPPLQRSSLAPCSWIDIVFLVFIPLAFIICRLFGRVIRPIIITIIILTGIGHHDRV